MTRPPWPRLAALALILAGSQAASTWWLRSVRGQAPTAAPGGLPAGRPDLPGAQGPGGAGDGGSAEGARAPSGPGRGGGLPTPEAGTGADLVARLDTKLARQVIAGAERLQVEPGDVLPPDEQRRAAILSDSLDSEETRALLDAYSAALQRLKVAD